MVTLFAIRATNVWQTHRSWISNCFRRCREFGVSSLPHAMSRGNKLRVPRYYEYITIRRQEFLQPFAFASQKSLSGGALMAWRKHQKRGAHINSFISPHRVSLMSANLSAAHTFGASHAKGSAPSVTAPKIGRLLQGSLRTQRWSGMDGYGEISQVVGLPIRRTAERRPAPSHQLTLTSKRRLLVFPYKYW
jgi:hypothetical protein